MGCVDDDVVGRLHLLEVGTRSPPALARLAALGFAPLRTAPPGCHHRLFRQGVRGRRLRGVPRVPAELAFQLVDPGPERFEDFPGGFLLRHECPVLGPQVADEPLIHKELLPQKSQLVLKRGAQELRIRCHTTRSTRLRAVSGGYARGARAGLLRESEGLGLGRVLNSYTED